MGPENMEEGSAESARRLLVDVKPMSTAVKEGLGQLGLIGSHEAEILDQSFESFFRLGENLKEGVIQHRWNSVLGDDTSGHLPAIFVHHLMKRYAKEHDQKIPVIEFLGPDGEDWFEEDEPRRWAMQKILEKRQPRLGSRTLVVTEFIYEGRHLRELLEAFPVGTDFDIASLSISYYVKKHALDAPLEHYGLDDVALKSKDCRFFYGEAEGVPALYSQGHLVGRKKNKSSPVAFRAKNWDPKLVSTARQVVVDMANETYDRIFNSAEEKLAA